jgi:SAM-dependent methyltransferase
MPMSAYDKVLYPSHPHPQTHPNRLATVGALFGLHCAPVRHCRVLELGCGDGSNVIPMAWSYPDSEFLGVDLAAHPIASGQRMIAELGLKNVRLVQDSILSLRPGWQEFDYIIAHGLYSWVPADLRQHILALCGGCLAPTGVAFVSYAAYPGCHLRNMIREMMLFHVRGFDTPEERIPQATALLRFLAGAQEVQDEYRRWLKVELDRVLEHDPGHLYHDDLADVNQPFYFTQFMAEASRHSLQYLGEADFFEMSDHVFTPSVRQMLDELSKNRILREQYLDFLKCRRFRQTLLCRGETQLTDKPILEAVASFRVSSALTCPTPPVDLRPGIAASFEAPRGAKAQTDFPLGKACLLALAERGFIGLDFGDLLEQAKKRLEDAGLAMESGVGLRTSLCKFLLRLYNTGVIDFHSSPVIGAATPSQTPVASPIARWQIRHGNIVTSLFHMAVQVEDDIGRQLLSLLDGTRDRKALADALWQYIQSQDPSPGTDSERSPRRDTLESDLEKNLVKLSRLGLLVA